jgi:CBS domain-containing protein
MERITLILERKGAHLHTVSDESPITDALQQMRSENVDYLVVLNDNERFLGIITDHDIATKIISGKKDLEVCLLHMLAPLPPELREFRGSEDAKLEEQLDREMVVAGQRWTREAENAARPVFENAISILTRAGVPPNSIRLIVRQLVNHEDLTDDILKLAEENACQTIVVGVVVPWFKETFHRHQPTAL